MSDRARKASGLTVVGLVTVVAGYALMFPTMLVVNFALVALGRAQLPNLSAGAAIVFVAASGFLVLSSAGYLTALVRQVHGALRLSAWVRVRRSRPSPRLARAARISGLGAPVVEVTSEGVFALTYGLITPRVVVSTGLVARTSDAELVAVLRHERQHARSLDPLTRFVLRVISGAFLYLPVVRDMARHVSSRRELLADRAALGESGRHALAGALYKVVSGPAYGAAVAAIGSADLLEARVAHLESGELPRFAKVSSRGLWLSVPGLAAVAGLMPVATIMAHQSFHECCRFVT